MRKNNISGYKVVEQPLAPEKPIWKPIPDNDITGYVIDQHGRVRSDDRSRHGRATSSGHGSYILDDNLVRQFTLKNPDVRYVNIRECGTGITRSVNKMMRQAWGVDRKWKFPT